MVTQQDYEDLARTVEYIFTQIVEVNATASNLHVPIPQDLARAWAHMGTAWPAEIRAEGTRHVTEPLTGWLESAGYQRADEEPDPTQETDNE